MAVRERRTEIAVLKTLGFTKGRILSLYVGEAITISLIGGLMGSLAASLLSLEAPCLAEFDDRICTNLVQRGQFLHWRARAGCRCRTA